MSDEKGDYFPPEGAEVGFNFKTPYVVPNGNNIGFNFKYLWYHPPKGNNIGFNFTEAYTPPSGNSIGFNFSNSDDSTPGDDQYIFPESFFTEQFGTLELKLYTRYVRMYDLVSLSIGQPSIRNSQHALKPFSFNSSLFGQPSAINRTHKVFPGGFDSARTGQPGIRNVKTVIPMPGISFTLYGKPRISFALQEAAVKQADPFTSYGVPAVTYGVRYIEQHNLASFDRFGTAWLSFSPRYIEPRGIFELFSTNHQVGGHRKIQPAGFDALRFGTRIIPESRTIYPVGFKEIFGDTEISNYRRHLYPKGFLTEGTELHHRFGVGKIWNGTQYVLPEGIALGPVFGNALNIINRNRQIQTYGQPQTRFGYQQLDNNARLIGPQGIPSPIEVEKSKTMVAFKIRPFAIPSIEAPYISSRHIIHLGAKVTQMQGRILSLFGQPSLVNTRRYFNYIGLGEQHQFGKPMIADAIRHLEIESNYGIHPPVIPLPTVFHGQRRVEMFGLDSVRYGEAYVVSQFTKATPRWYHTERVGEPVIRNVTPQVRMWGLFDAAYGKPYIGHYTRLLKPQGLYAQIFGGLRIADSTQTIDLSSFGIKSEQINRLHEIKNLRADASLPKRIQPAGIFLERNFGQPSIRHNVLRPESKVMTLFGNTRIAANTIRFEAGYWDFLIGTPTIGNLNRIFQMGASLDFMAVGTPRLSPHTIYAVVEAPDQAKRNHPSPRNLHYVNAYVQENYLKEPGFDIGIPTITHKQRFIRAAGFSLNAIGVPEIKNAREIITPKGLNTMRFGVISPLGTQEIKFRNPPFGNVFGSPAIRHIVKPDPYVRPTGRSFNVFGQTTIDFYNRELKPSGFNALQMGTKKDNDQPYMWQGLRIGAPVPTNAGGQLHTQIGNAWISFRVREIRAGGEDFSHVNEYDPSNFKQRMFVWNRNQPALPDTQLIVAQGFNSFTTRVPDIKPAAHYIRPDGNVDNYRKGGF